LIRAGADRLRRAKVNLVAALKCGNSAPQNALAFALQGLLALMDVTKATEVLAKAVPVQQPEEVKHHHRESSRLTKQLSMDLLSNNSSPSLSPGSLSVSSVDTEDANEHLSQAGDFDNLIPETFWQSKTEANYRLVFKLFKLRMELEHQVGHHAISQSLVSVLKKRARPGVDAGRIAVSRRRSCRWPR